MAPKQLGLSPALPLTRVLALVLIGLSFFSSIALADELDDLAEDITARARPSPRNDLTRHYPDLTVLGYVTPWNSLGASLVTEYRTKFDIVSPVWYTVHPSPSSIYTILGGPPTPSDETWYRALQRPDAGNKSVLVTPRFLLDGWAHPDYQAFLYNETRWSALRDAILHVINTAHFDGLVLEASAPGPLAQPLGLLSSALHASGKILIVVSPPLRSGGDDAGQDAALERHNRMILQFAGALSKVVDHVSVMTYDMSGTGGRLVRGEFPEGSPARRALREGRLREPGGNTGREWVRENLAGFMEEEAAKFMESQGDGRVQFGSADEGKGGGKTKFLAGLPLYGYRYPVVFLRRESGRPVQPKGLPVGEDLIAVLRGAGSAITTLEIQELVDDLDPEMQETEDGEAFFDYANEDGFWRVFTPAADSMERVLDVVRKVHRGADELTSGGAGIALWEVGQSSRELLEVL